MIEIDFNGNPFEDSRDIKDGFSIKPSEIDKVNAMVDVSYFNIKHNKANPLDRGYSVILDTSKHDRYSYIQNIKTTTVGRVSAVLGHSHVNVSFESTVPATVKNVPVAHLKLVEASLVTKFISFLKRFEFVRKFLVKQLNKKKR